MGSFTQRLGKKVKSVGKTMAKVGMGALAVGGAVLGAKALYDEAGKVKGAVEDANVIAQDLTAKPIVQGNIIDAKKNLANQVEKVELQKNIALDRVSNPEIPSLKAIKENQAQQQERVAQAVSRTQAGGMTDKNVELAVRMAKCSQKHGGKGLMYNRCMKKG
jgi:hypothetical protein